MKSPLFKKFEVFTIVLFLLLVASCSSNYETIPYKVGQSYIFKVTVIDSNSIVLHMDTIDMTIKNKGIIGKVMGMNMTEWKSHKFKDNKQKRGINIEPDMVEIQMPINYNYLENENIVIAGYPSFSKSMLIGYSSESDHKFIKGYGKLSNKKLKQYRAVIDSSQVEFNDVLINCKVSVGKNVTSINEFGLYKLKTYYNNDFGFVKIVYTYPNRMTILFELIEIKNNEP